jgi:hypothetical protein
MVKNTWSSNVMDDKRTPLAFKVGRLMVMLLLILAVISVAMPGSMGTKAEAQSSYRSATFSAGSSPLAAKIADLDSDGLNDIAVINLQGSLQLFFNNGAGSFERVSLNGLWATISNASDIDIGDLNGDGRNDLAVAFETQRESVSVLLNQGNRAFAAPLNYDSCNASTGIAIGDLDQDGDNDLVDIGRCSQASVFLNNGQGIFTLSGTYGQGSDSKSIALADFNSDGFKDIVYLNRTVDSRLTILFNNGNATFGTPEWRFSFGLLHDLTVGDLDGDGNTDIATPNGSDVFMLHGDNMGNFPGYSEIYAGDAPLSVAVADFNGDGRPDFAVVNLSHSVSIVLNTGFYNYSFPSRFSVGQYPVDIAAGNLDSDGLPDLVAVNQGSASITVLFSAGGAPDPPPPAPQITLTASTRTTIRARLVDLRWSAATSSSLNVYRNGSRIATVSNSGSYTDQLSRRTTGTFTYKVCVAGGQCSNEATVRF